MKKDYSKGQLIFLLVLRFVIGWHILYEGVSKILNPQWTSANFLRESQGFMSGIADAILSNPDVLNIVNILNAWGLVAIGIAIIFGFIYKPAAIIGSILIFIYYLSTPPLVGFEYSIPTEGSNLVVNRTLVEAIALFGLAMFPTNKIFGLDYFILANKKSK